MTLTDALFDLIIRPMIIRHRIKAAKIVKVKPTVLATTRFKRSCDPCVDHKSPRGV